MCFALGKELPKLTEWGRIILHEVLYNDEKTGPFAAAAYSMIMQAWAPGGRQYSQKELVEMLQNAGFMRVEIIPTFGFMSIVTGQKN